MLKWIAKIFGQGFMAFIPLSVTVALIVWLGTKTEHLIANPIVDLFPKSGEVYRAGMGIAACITMIFLLGLLMNLWLVRSLFGWIERKIERVPLVKTLYGGIKDVMKFFGGNKDGQAGNQCVMVTLENGWRQIGIITRTEFDDLPPEITGGRTNLVAVYVPFSYQLGGFTYFMDKAQCEPVPGMTMEDAMRYAAMAWMGAPGSEGPKNGKHP